MKMIKHIVKGSKSTSIHDFELSTNEMGIVISSGTYYQSSEVIFHNGESVTIPIPTRTYTVHYEVWLTKYGFELLERTDSQEFEVVTNPIDRLGWFSIPPNGTVEDAEIHIVKMVDE